MTRQSARLAGQPEHLPRQAVAGHARRSRSDASRPFPGGCSSSTSTPPRAAALRPPSRDGRRPALVGGAEGPVVRHERQAARREGRGPPARVRRFRGRDSRGQLRRGRRDRVGPRRVDRARGLARRTREGKAPVRAPRLQAPRQVDAREDQEERARLAAHQGARRVREVAGRRSSTRRRCSPG